MKRLTTKVQMGCYPPEPPTRPKPAEIRHLQMHHSRIGVQNKVMSPVPQPDQTGAHHWTTPLVVDAPLRCGSFEVGNDQDILHVHRLPLAVLLLRGRSFRLPVRFPSGLSTRTDLGSLIPRAGSTPKSAARQKSPKSLGTGLKPSARTSNKRPTG